MRISLTVTRPHFAINSFQDEKHQFYEKLRYLMTNKISRLRDTNPGHLNKSCLCRQKSVPQDTHIESYQNVAILLLLYFSCTSLFFFFRDLYLNLRPSSQVTNEPTIKKNIFTSENLLFMNLLMSEDLPTLASPTRTTLQSWRASARRWRTLPIVRIIFFVFSVQFRRFRFRQTATTGSLW